MKKQEENIISLDFTEEMRNSFRDYALSVIIARALPDVRDGLKPVQRRILYAMTELGLDPKKPHRKSARIVGDTMGKYHPHGDSSIYDALVHLSEDFSLSIPLVDGHGNFGSIDGDGAAAMRYTEARLSTGAMTMLEHLDKGLVEFVPNFDDSEQEPAVLPAMLPNLLINGTTGIAVGMATNMPPHNPGEVIDGVIAYIDKPTISLPELMQYIKGPDFPTGGTIINSDLLPAIYETGEGKLRVRAKTVIESGDSGRKNIVITEIPYTAAGSKTRLVENLVALMKDKVFDEIYDVRDESSKEGIRIIIEVKKDRDIDNLLNGLFKKSSMEDTYGVNLLAVKEQQPITFSLKSLIVEFVSFQEELYTKQYKHLLEKAKKRLEIVDGLIRATDVIDLIIEILRGSSSLKQAKGCLINGDTTAINFKNKGSKDAASKLDFTEHQADAILAMPLSKLIGLEILKLHEENQTLLDQVSEYEKVLGNRKELMRVIKNNLKEYRKVFARPRRTVLANMEAASYVEEVVIEDVYLLIDKFGYVKCVDTGQFSRASEEILKEFVHVVKLENTDKLCVFTAQGSMYQVKCGSIPRCKLKDKGVLIHTLCKVGHDDVLFYTSYEEMFESQLLFLTKQGYIKLVSGAEFDTNRTVITTTKLEEKDAIISITKLSAGDILHGGIRVIVLTTQGLSLGFPLDDVPELKKTSRGVKAITLEKKDSVVYGGALASKQDTFLFNGKQLSSKKVKMRRRTAKGQKTNLEFDTKG